MVRPEVRGEKECSFCHRPAKDVPSMIEGDMLWSRICSDCVKACVEVVERNERPGTSVTK